MRNRFAALLLVLGSLSGLSGCSTLDAVNPFDKSEAQKRADQGEVAGQSERLSILELNDQLSVTEAPSPESIILPEPYVNTDWPQLGGNTQHVVQHTGASGPLKKDWSKSIGSGSSAHGRIVAPPVIVGGMIYTVDARYRVKAMDEQNGKTLWEYKTKSIEYVASRTRQKGVMGTLKAPITSTKSKDKEGVGGGIAYADGRLYVATGIGRLVALDPATGEEIWTQQSRVPLHSAPTISDGRLFVITDDNELFAYDATNGEVLWTYQALVESARMLTAPAPAIVDDVVIAPFSSGEIVALRAQNGGVLWSDSLSSSTRLTPLAALNDISGGPAVADGYVISSTQSGVTAAFDFRTGQRVWAQPAGSLGIPLIVGDLVYVVTTEGQVAALSKLDGSVLWLQQLEAFKNAKKRKHRIVWTGPILAGNRLVVASSRGKYAILDPRSGEVLDTRNIGGSVFVPPVIANETLYFVTDSGKLVALK